MISQLRGVWLIIVAGFACGPRLAVVGFTAEPIASGLAIASTVQLRAIVQGVTDGDLDAARRGGILLIGMLSTAGLIAMLGWRHRMALREKVAAWFEDRILTLSAQIPGLEHHERAEYADKMQILRWAGGSIGSTVTGLVPAISAVVRMTVATILLAGLHSALILLPVLGIPSVIASARTRRLLDDMREASAEDDRRTTHLFQVATEAGAGKEVRVFGLRTTLLTRFNEISRRIEERVAHTRIRAAATRSIGTMIFVAGYIAAIVFIAVRASKGQATEGDVFLAIALAGQVNGIVTMSAESVHWILGSLRHIDDYRWLEREASLARRRVGGEPPPARLERGIRFEHLSFTYPGTDRTVLLDVDLSLPAGARVAIVGDNGAGKTTLAKLLCGFYAPTSGRITIDGVDLARIDLDAWRQRTAGGFQDYCRFEFAAGETVGIGDLPRVNDEGAIRESLGRAGATDIEGKLGSGLGTQLGRSFDGGTDLSMGQWQKLALGRAFMREAPLLLILDEPTASLDAKTEHALFQRYAAEAEQRRAEGGITVLVSHRFSTVRDADLIVVVEGGRIRETGSHAELIAAGGLYAELFTLQAAAYA